MSLRHFIVGLSAVWLSSISSAATPPDLLGAGYSVYTQDRNGDGCPDFLVKAPDRLVVIALDEDFILPLPVPALAKPVLLQSNAACTYTLTNSPDNSVIREPGWAPSSYQLLAGDSAGTGGGSLLLVPHGSGGSTVFNLLRDPSTKAFSLLQALSASDYLVGSDTVSASLEYADPDTRTDFVVRNGSRVLGVFSADADGRFSSDSSGNLVAITHAVWKTFIGQLAAGNAEAALASVSVVTQEVFRKALTSPQADMPGFAASVEDFTIVEVSGAAVSAVFNITTNGEKLNYVAVFGPDMDGTWRLFSM